MDGPTMWEPFLLLALIAAAVRWVRRPHGPATAPLPDVDDAPSDAEPLMRPHLDDNGLGTYSMVTPRRARRSRSGVARRLRTT